ALRQERSRLAKEEGRAAFIICHNRTLKEMAATKPRDLEQMAAICGMGPAKIAAYGDKWMAVIARHCQEPSQW
ncbi:MAG: HRDC domain-containing protein, partial [Polyangiales bacterium]